MKFAEYTVDEFNEKLASKAPTPGGGSVAGLGAALSAALIEMVINLTDDEALKQKVPEVKEKRKRALELIDEDSESFDQVMNAFRMAKDSEKEKEERRKAIQSALYAASLTPLDTMNLGLKLLKIARAIICNSNPNAISDIGVAGFIGMAAVNSAKLNVLINASSLNNDEKADKLEKEAENIENEAKELLNEIQDITLNKIN
ncbi:MAG: cyclodeaminase/cyclohydrolase family protein [Bacillota bacterium]